MVQARGAPFYSSSFQREGSRPSCSASGTDGQLTIALSSMHRLTQICIKADADQLQKNEIS
ncbi:MAG: hypothetical protein ABI618_03250 [Nitrospirota bacterium]